MKEPILDPYEKELVRFFAKRYFDRAEVVALEELPHLPEVEQQGMGALERIIAAELIE